MWRPLFLLPSSLLFLLHSSLPSRGPWQENIRACKTKPEEALFVRSNVRVALLGLLGDAQNSGLEEPSPPAHDAAARRPPWRSSLQNYGGGASPVNGGSRLYGGDGDGGLTGTRAYGGWAYGVPVLTGDRGGVPRPRYRGSVGCPGAGDARRRAVTTGAAWRRGAASRPMQRPASTTWRASATAVLTTACCRRPTGCPSSSCHRLVFGLVPSLFWTTLLASWGGVGFPSVLCQVAQYRFR